MLKNYFILFSIIILVSCAKNYNLNPNAMQPLDSDKLTVDMVKECQHLYEPKKWEIAVLEFDNNTGYGDMDIKNTSSNTKGNAKTVGVGVGVAKVDRRGNAVGVGVGASNTNFKYSTNSVEFMGQFAPSLGTFAQSITEETLSQLGGVTLINRSHLEKVLKEQQFQMTIADPDTIMEFGRLSGVKYIVTGSVDNIQAKYVAPSNVRADGSDLAAIISLVSATYDVAASGWFVSSKMTISLIDAETGEVIHSKSVEDKIRASQSQNFQPDVIINAAKKIMSDAVNTSKNEFMKIFEVTGYINELRGGKKIAHINLGNNKGIQAGNVFDVYNLNISTDFLTKEKKCDLVKLDAKIVVSDQISEDGSWGFIKGSKSVLDNIKIGTYIKRVSLSE